MDSTREPGQAGIMDNPAGTPSLRVRLLFWLLLGMLSTALAEVTVSSQVAPFFTLEGWLLVVPVYLLHILVLGHLVTVRHRPTMSLVWTAGILFGMYEFLITKVIWNPPWAEEPLRLAGIAIPEFVVLALFYHAFFAFLLPLWIAERSMTTSRSIPLPGFLSRFLGRGHAWALTAVWGLVLGATARDRVILSLMSVAVVAASVWLWRRRGLGRWTLIELMPNRREFGWLAGALGVLYLFSTVALRPEALPGPAGWISLLVLYAVFIGLFLRVTRIGSAEPQEARVVSLRAKPVALGAVSGIVVGVAFPQGLAEPLMVAIIWGGGGVIGLTMLWHVARDALRRTRLPST